MKKAVNEFLDMVQDTRDRLPALAKDLQANSHRVEWSCEDDGSQTLEYKCRIQLTFGRFDNYHCGSYISLQHPFEQAEDSVRAMHSKWKADNMKYEAEQREKEIKDRLYAEYLEQNSSPVF